MAASCIVGNIVFVRGAQGDTSILLTTQGTAGLRIGVAVGAAVTTQQRRACALEARLVLPMAGILGKVRQGTRIQGAVSAHTSFDLEGEHGPR